MTGVTVGSMEGHEYRQRVRAWKRWKGLVAFFNITSSRLSRCLHRMVHAMLCYGWDAFVSLQEVTQDHETLMQIHKLKLQLQNFRVPHAALTALRWLTQKRRILMVRKWQHWVRVLQLEHRGGSKMLYCLARIRDVYLHRAWNTMVNMQHITHEHEVYMQVQTLRVQCGRERKERGASVLLLQLRRSNRRSYNNTAPKKSYERKCPYSPISLIISFCMALSSLGCCSGPSSTGY